MLEVYVWVWMTEKGVRGASLTERGVHGTG
jgi:hypothetical protein